MLIILAYLLRVNKNIYPIRCGDSSFSPFIDIFLILLFWLTGMHSHLWIYIHDFKTHILAYIIYKYQYLRTKRKAKNAFEQAINMTRKTAIPIGPIGVLNCEMTTFTSYDSWVQSRDISFHLFWLVGYNSVVTTQNHIKETLQGLYSTLICTVPPLS